MRADAVRPRKDLENLRRGRVGRDVKILGLSPQQQIAHAPADQEGKEPAVAEFLGDLSGQRGRIREAHASDRRIETQAPPYMSTPANKTWVSPKVVVATTVALSFISFWRGAAIV